MGKNRWPELCRLVEQDDGLPVRDNVGAWTENKLCFWNRYVDITTRAMVGHPKWPEGLVYVDLFGGPGVCALSGSRRRIPGSPLIAAHAPKPFRKILVCERDPALAEACEKRLAATEVHENCRVFVGDCNDKIDDVIAEIPPRALTLAFVDPTGLHVAFETVAKLSRRRRVDLLILFPDAVDVLRNVELYEKQGQDSNLDRVLGPDSAWRERWQQLAVHETVKTRNLFVEIYEDQLRKHLQYKHFREKPMKSKHMAIYRLIYASKHELGLKFWEEATRKDAAGQKEFF